MVNQKTLTPCEHTVTQYFRKRKAKYAIQLRKKERDKLLRKLLVRYGYVCWYCGIKLNLHQIHVDHIIPRSGGGDNDILNLAIACRSCNLSKSELDIDIFYSWIDHIRSSDFRRIYKLGEPHPLSSIFLKTDD